MYVNILIIAVLCCNIERRGLPIANFQLIDRPVIYMRPRGHEKEYAMISLVNATAKETLMSQYANEPVVLASSNRYSRRKVDSTLGEYIRVFEAEVGEDGHCGTKAGRDNHIHESDTETEASECRATERLYLFGDNHGPLWSHLELLYEPLVPPCAHCTPENGLATFGLGGKYSGVTFHQHGPGFAEVLHGSKHWFFYPPGSQVPGSQDDTTMEEWASTYWHNQAGDGSAELYECELFRGEIIYFPPNWEHGTLNNGTFNSFVSYFLAGEIPVVPAD